MQSVHCSLYQVKRTASEDALKHLILQKYDELVSLVESCDDESANAEPEAPASNSVLQILVHCCGMMRRWSSSVNLGRVIPRDRDQEFEANMSVTEVRTLAEHARSAFVGDVEATDMQSAPLQVPPGREHFWTATCEGVLLHVLEEISQHLGHAQITYDLLIHAKPELQPTAQSR